VTEAPRWQAALDALAPGDDWGVRAAALVLERGWAAGYSDIHLATRRDAIELTARLDGALVPLARLAHGSRGLLAARLKVLAGLPAFVRHEPQDGRIAWESGAAPAARHTLRLSFLPTLHGESVVIRFPRDGATFLPLDGLGMSPPVLEAARALLRGHEGAIVLAGPGGSGKTTTLYAMLAELATAQPGRLRMITIEDPVERELDFASQVAVNEAQGLGFEKALRAALRQDPNVLLVGEIRDVPTASVAMQAGTTGHLVLTSLHASRAAGVATRLLAMGIEPYIVAAALRGAVAQRLVRRLCPHCRRAAPGGGWESPGCPRCEGTGCAGRTGVFEVARLTESLRAMVLGREPLEELQRALLAAQGTSLLAEARKLVENGIIGAAELSLIFADELDEAGESGRA
jgi:general secretion pathway protein E